MIRAISYTSLWFGTIVWGLLAGALLVGTGYILYQDFLFASDAKPVQGVVERKFYKISHGRHGSTNYTPWLNYQYPAPGMTVACERSVQGDTYARLYPGGLLPILYVSSQPADNRIDMPAENRQIRIITWLLIAVSLVVGVGGAFTLRYYVRQNKLNRYLLSSGLTSQGTVTEIKFDLVGKARTQRDYLVFQFRDNQGRENHGAQLVHQTRPGIPLARTKHGPGLLRSAQFGALHGRPQFWSLRAY